MKFPLCIGWTIENTAETHHNFAVIDRPIHGIKIPVPKLRFFKTHNFYLLAGFYYKATSNYLNLII